MSDHITQTPLEGYRPCVGIFLLNRDSFVFVGKRINLTNDAWQFPQGGIDKGERPEEAAFREMEEEIGTANATIVGTSRWWHSYDLPEDIAKRMWKGRYKGQCQKWIAMRFLGEDSEINLDAHAPEFRAWRWVAPKSAIELAVSFKQQIYVSVVDEFRHLWA